MKKIILSIWMCFFLGWFFWYDLSPPKHEMVSNSVFMEISDHYRILFKTDGIKLPARKLIGRLYKTDYIIRVN